ncbi:unnamed protein product [Rotaria sordida]|uniref:Uncharacterized protein n=1 Tax=Rotaria sordida TaxID=392033 RepID=A0A815BF18_9BILA|nr:unnamed protein product [Rotaria sordida]CAF3807860.1 unnamed protein product [Rotaria sordida]
MFWTNRSLCSIRLISNTLIRCLPRVATSHEHPTVTKSSDYAVINTSQQSQTVVFNDYNVVKPISPRIQSRPVPKSVPKLIDVQTGLNHFMNECDERMLLMTVENKYKLFDCNNVATFIQRLHDLNIKRDSNEKHHQRFYDFVDYLILKHGQQLDFDHVLKMYYQLASLNGNAKLHSHSGNYALKGLIQLLKHYVNKYHLQDTSRILITLEKDLGCNIYEDERIRPLFDALFLLTKFRQNELDRLDAQALAELAYVFALELDHIYFTNILNEYIHDELHHDKYSTILMFRALNRRNYRHNRTLDICLHFVHENKEMFTEEIDEIKQYLKKLKYEMSED